jgi:2-amino-4-hydroxy-6-hydroxymethyldihydropteridine diphosphokinase
MPRSLIGLGSNLGDRAELVRQAIAALAAHPHVRLLAQSDLYETLPIGGPVGQLPYLNAAATVETSLGPGEVLDVLQAIEQASGRERLVRWSARTLDLDLLLYDELVLDTPRLILPHPRLAFRRFALEPAIDVAADWRHPAIGWSLQELWRHLTSAAPYAAITGPLRVGKTALAQEVATAVQGRWLADPPLADRPDRDPAGQALAIEIEFLRTRRQLLSAVAGDLTSPWTISDFWLDQSLAFAAVTLPSKHMKAVEAEWGAARATVATPKLLIQLDASVSWLLPRLAQHSGRVEPGWDAGRLEQLRAALTKQIDRSWQGPILRLSAEQPQAARTEIEAALAAMR